jgi:hypothetical protein
MFPEDTTVKKKEHKPKLPWNLQNRTVSDERFFGSVVDGPSETFERQTGDDK